MKRVIKESVMSSKNTNPKNATFKNDKRLSPTSERYKGYLIVLDRGGDGYNVYDKHRELEDAGYPSREAAKQFIDELIDSGEVTSSEDIKSKSPYEVKHGITYTRLYSNDSGDQISIFVYDDDPDKQEYGEGGPSGDYFRGRWTQNMQDYYTRRGFKLDNTLKQNVSSAIDNIEREFQRIDRSGTHEDVKVTSATTSEYALLKNTYSHLREFEDKDKQSGNIRDLMDELENKDISYDVYYNKTNNGCTIFYNGGNIVSASKIRGKRQRTIKGNASNVTQRTCYIPSSKPDYCPHCCNRSLIHSNNGEAKCQSCGQEYQVEKMSDTGRIKLVYLDNTLVSSSAIIANAITNSFMKGDHLEWSGLYGGQYKGVVTDVNDEYITVDVMWIAEDTGDMVTDTQKFEITTDSKGKKCIIVWTYGSHAGYVYPPSCDNVNSAEAVDNSEREFQRIDRSVTSSETFDVHSYAKQRKQSSEFNKWLKRVESAILRNDTTRIKNIKESLMYMTPSQLSNKLTSYLIDKLNSALTTSSDDIKSASYGGAFDIENDQFFTKDEIVEFGNTVCDHLNETLHDTYDVSDVYMETPKKLVLTIVQKSDESEFTATIDIDMRKIKRPADLMNRYLGDAVYALQQDIKAYNDEINASSDIDITAARKSNVDLLKTKIWNTASAEMEDMGFPVDEIPDYLFVDLEQADDHIRIEVRAEVSYEGIEDLITSIDPVIQEYDKDAYFEPVEPGIAEAYIYNLSNVNSSETVEAEIYDIPDRPLDPPEDNSWEEIDTDDEFIEITLDAIVHIDENDSWNYEDTNYPWAASPDSKSGDWYTDKYGVYIGDKTSIVEYVDELLEPMMPAKEGEYHIKGDVTLVFSVEGVEAKIDRFGDEEVYTDDAETSFLYDKSYIKNFEITER